MHGYVAIPLSATVRELLGVPLKPRVMLVTLNEQFFMVSDSCRSEQVADGSSLTYPEQLPQSDVMRYCTVEHSEFCCDQLNSSSSGPTLVRLTSGDTLPQAAISNKGNNNIIMVTYL